MKLGYMTNAFGPLVGEGGGVTSIKDIRYLTLCDDEAVLKKITNTGFRYIEVLEGNLTKYGSDIQVLKDMLARYGAGMMSVCVGANFIYPDALEDEMFHMETVAALAEQVGVSYVAFCGGAIRGRGVQTGDYALLAKGLKEAEKVFAAHGIEASYHPHLGSMAEKPEQIDRLFFGERHQDLPGSGASGCRRRRSSGDRQKVLRQNLLRPPEGFGRKRICPAGHWARRCRRGSAVPEGKGICRRLSGGG